MSSVVRAAAFAACLTLLTSATVPGQPSVPDSTVADEIWQQAVAMVRASPDDPVATWVLSMNAYKAAALVEHVRRAEETASPPSGTVSAEVAEAGLERLGEVVPPQILELLRLEGLQGEEKRQALLAVAAEYPDDPVVLWRTVLMHSSADEDELARRMAEAFTSRNPGDAGGYNVLFGLLKPAAEDRHPVLRRWAEATPGSGALVKAWMGSGLPEADPQATGELIERFFASQPAGRSGLGGCIGLLDASATAVVEKATRCVSRILREPGLPPSEVQVMRSELAWSHPQVLASLMSGEDASPDIRSAELLRAAVELNTPERCDKVLELVDEAVALHLDPMSAGTSVGLLRRCEGRSDSNALFLRIAGELPEGNLPFLVEAWMPTSRFPDSELPPGTVSLLTERLAEAPDSRPLQEALATASRIREADGNYLNLLQNRSRQDSEPLSAREAKHLAEGLVAEGDPEAALEVLEAQLRSNTYGYSYGQAELIDLLSNLYARGGQPGRAKRYGDELVATGKRGRIATGHLLAARAAMRRGDGEAAVSHYLGAMNDLNIQPLLAYELLDHGEEMEAYSVQALADRICSETKIVHDFGNECQARLLTRWKKRSEQTEPAQD